MFGSSPLTRGKLSGPRNRSQRWGLIPAHAGKTSSAYTCVHHRRAHPRSRGENPASAGIKSVKRGSSPLTRGKRQPDRADERALRLIPAHAGKTRRATWFFLLRSAHPRSRGENNPGDLASEEQLGSSPLTRGKLALCVWSRRHSGLIPAHAGKTRSPGPRVRSAWAHPRSRGENTS